MPSSPSSLRGSARRTAARTDAALPGLAAWLDALPGEACVLDATGRITATNQAWRSSTLRPATGCALDEGESYLAACAQFDGQGGGPASDEPPRGEMVSAMVSGLRAVLAGTQPVFQGDTCCHTAQGLRWVTVRFSRIAAGPGQDAQVLVLHHDTTPQHEARDALAQREAMLADLAASVPGAIFRLQQPASGPWRFVYLSPGFAQLTELEPGAVCADRRLFDRLVLPDDRPGVADGIRQALASGQTWSQAYRVRTARSGQLRWLRVVSRPGDRPATDGSRAWTGLILDITQAHAVEQALREREDTYRTLFETVPQGVVYHDPTGRITDANPAAQRILGLSLDQLQGRRSVDPGWRAVREDGSPLPGAEHPAMVAMRSRQPVNGVVMGVQVPARGTVWIEVSAIPIVRAGELRHVYACFEDISEQVRLRDELRRQASTDALTGVANRRSLVARLGEEFAHAQRHPGRPFSVLAVDIDLFKQVNDNWGHAAGDAALVQLARIMQRQTRPSDLVGRSGGEEFMVLLRDTDAAAAQALAERLRRAIARAALRHEGIRLRLSVSIGVAELRPDDATVDAVLARADRALYAAKHGGRNRVCLGLV